MSAIWKEAADAWLTAQRAVGRSAGTLATRGEHLRWLATWAGARSPWSLTTADLLEFMGCLLYTSDAADE